MIVYIQSFGINLLFRPSNCRIDIFFRPKPRNVIDRDTPSQFCQFLFHRVWGGQCFGIKIFIIIVYFTLYYSLLQKHGPEYTISFILSFFCLFISSTSLFLCQTTPQIQGATRSNFMLILRKKKRGF